MKTLFKLISFAALIAMFTAAIMVFTGKIDRHTWDAHETIALIGTIVWFVTVPFWMKRRLHQSE